MHRTLALFALAAAAAAQTKPTLLPADYGKWETLGTGTLSPDGKWMAYEIRRTSGDGELRIAPVSGGKSQTVAFCSGAAFSADSHWLACSTTVSEADQEKARKARTPLQNKLSIVDLNDGAVTKVDDVQSFAFAGDGPYLAFRKYPPTPAAPASNAAAAPAAGRGGRGGRGGGNGGDSETERDPAGAVLLVRNLSTGIDTTFGNITSYSWQDKGSNLAMAVGVEGRTGNSLQVYDPHSGSLRVLDNGPALFSTLTWRKESSDLAAFRSVKQDGYEGESHIALAWKNLGDKITVKGRRSATYCLFARTAVVGRWRHHLRRRRPVEQEDRSEEVRRRRGQCRDLALAGRQRHQRAETHGRARSRPQRHRRLAPRVRQTHPTHHQPQGRHPPAARRIASPRARWRALPERFHVRTQFRRPLQDRHGDRHARRGRQASDPTRRVQSRRPLRHEFQRGRLLGL
ncbi:MAG: hypothetical protein WDO73_09070 [Ignavibacteriota bacterium]